YYILSLAVTIGFSLAIASGSLAAMYQPVQVARHGAVMVAVVVVAVLLLNWSRDRLQRLIDRKFFREKFQLDKALQRMNQAAGDLLLLTSMRQSRSVALHSSGVHQAVARLNDELQIKIEKITEQERLISMLQS